MYVSDETVHDARVFVADFSTESSVGIEGHKGGQWRRCDQQWHPPSRAN